MTGTSIPAGAPVLEPGQYVDSLGEDETKYYSITLPRHHALHCRDQRASTRGLRRRDLRLGGDADQHRGGPCESGESPIKKQGSAIIPTSSVVTMEPIADGPVDEQYGCGAPGAYLVEVERNGSEVPRVQIELLVLLEPPVQDAAVLPAPTVPDPPRLPPTAPDGARRRPTARASRWSVVGSFGGAPVLAPGTYGDALRPGETSYYRVPVGWGQRLNITAVLAPAKRGKEDGFSLTGAQLAIFNPARQAVDADSTTSSDSLRETYRAVGNTDLQLHGWTAPYTWRNREAGRSEDVSTSSLAGEQYVALTMEEYIGQEDSRWEFRSASSSRSSARRRGPRTTAT